MFSPYKCIGTQIWPSRKKVKCQPRVIICTNLVSLQSLVLYTNIQPRSLVVSGVEDSLVFLPYIWAWRPSCLMMQNRLNNLIIALEQKVQYEIW